MHLLVITIMNTDNNEHSFATMQKNIFKALEDAAEPITSKLSEIQQLDETINDYFVFLGQDPASLKDHAANYNNNAKKYFIKLYSYIALAINPETGPQLKELLSQQLIMQQDMLDLLEEALEKQELAYTAGGVTIYKPTSIFFAKESDCNNINELDISATELNQLLDNYNDNQKIPVSIDATVILGTLNLLRDAREEVMEQHLKNLTKVLAEQANS